MTKFWQINTFLFCSCFLQHLWDLWFYTVKELLLFFFIIYYCLLHLNSIRHICDVAAMRLFWSIFHSASAKQTCFVTNFVNFFRFGHFSTAYVLPPWVLTIRNCCAVSLTSGQFDLLWPRHQSVKKNKNKNRPRIFHGAEWRVISGMVVKCTASLSRNSRNPLCQPPRWWNMSRGIKGVGRHPRFNWYLADFYLNK